MKYLDKLKDKGTETGGACSLLNGTTELISKELIDLFLDTYVFSSLNRLLSSCDEAKTPKFYLQLLECTLMIEPHLYETMLNMVLPDVSGNAHYRNALLLVNHAVFKRLDIHHKLYKDTLNENYKVGTKLSGAENLAVIESVADYVEKSLKFYAIEFESKCDSQDSNLSQSGEGDCFLQSKLERFENIDSVMGLYDSEGYSSDVLLFTFSRKDASDSKNKEVTTAIDHENLNYFNYFKCNRL